MHSSGFFRIKPIARFILKHEISRSHTISDQSLLLSTIVLNDMQVHILKSHILNTHTHQSGTPTIQYTNLCTNTHKYKLLYILHSLDQHHTHHHPHFPLHTVLPCLGTSCEHKLVSTCPFHQISPCPDMQHTCHNLVADIPKGQDVTTTQ